MLAYLALAGSRRDTAVSVCAAAATDATLASQIASLGTASAIPVAVLVGLFGSSSTGGDISMESAISVVAGTSALLAIALLVVDPMLSSSAGQRIPRIRSFKLLFPVAALTSIFIGSTAFERTVNVADCVIGTITYLGKHSWDLPARTSV